MFPKPPRYNILYESTSMTPPDILVSHYEHCTDLLPPYDVMVPLFPYTLMDLTASFTFLSETVADSEGPPSLGSEMPPFSPYLSESDYLLTQSMRFPTTSFSSDWKTSD